MKDPELAVKKWVASELAPTLDVWEYCDYPVTNTVDKPKIIWASTVNLGEAGSKDDFISTVALDITLVQRLEQNYLSTLELLKGKELVLEKLVKRSLMIDIGGFRLLSAVLAGTEMDYERQADKMITFAKLTINIRAEEL